MKYILSILFYFSCLYGFSQNPVYNQTWIGGAYQKNFDVKNHGNAINIRFDGSYRSIEWFKYNRQFIIREITTYRFNDTWQIGAGPCFSWQYPYGDMKPVTEFRPTVQLTCIKPSVNGEINIRARWEFRYFKIQDQWTEVSLRPRLAFRWQRNLNERLQFTPMIESMWQKDPGDRFEFSVFRIIPGFTFKTKKIQFVVAYMFQFLERGSQDEIDNNYIFMISN